MDLPKESGLYLKKGADDKNARFAEAGRTSGVRWLSTWKFTKKP